MEYITGLINNILTLTFDDLVSHTTTFTTKIFIIVAIIAVGYGFKKIADFITKKICRNLNFNPVTCGIIETIFLLMITSFVIVLVLLHLGFHLPSLVALEHKIAALGFSGILLTMVLKGSAENTFAGFGMARSNKIKIGDYIIIQPNNKVWEGKIINIDMKHTTLETKDETIYIPNSSLTSYEVGIIHSKSDRFAKKKKIKKTKK